MLRRGWSLVFPRTLPHLRTITRSMKPNVQTKYEGGKDRGRERFWRRAGGAAGVCSLVWSGVGSVMCAELEDLHVEELSSGEVQPLEMNEASALTHTTLLRQASGVVSDSALQLLHRTLRAMIDFSVQYRQLLNDMIDLLEYCIATVQQPVQHGQFWDMVVASRSEMESVKQQLKDLNILMLYAITLVENAAMAAYINGVEFTATCAQQTIDGAKLEVEKIRLENGALETKYAQTHAQYIAVSQKVVDEAEAKKKEEEGKEKTLIEGKEI